MSFMEINLRLVIVVCRSTSSHIFLLIVTYRLTIHLVYVSTSFEIRSYSGRVVKF